MTINGMTVQANNADQFAHTMAMQHQQHQMDANQYQGRKRPRARNCAPHSDARRFARGSR